MALCSHTTSQSPYIYTLKSINTPHDYREITTSIVNGVDISLVSPELYENLLPYIDQYILKFQDINDISSVNRLKFCRDYIYKYPERERIAKILTKRKSDPPPEPLPFTSEQLDEEIKRLLSLKKINSSNVNYSPKEIDQLLIEMRNRRLEAAEEEDFDLADRLAYISTRLSSQGAINQIRKIKIDHAEELKQKLEETKGIYNDLQERWKIIQINFKAETAKELNQMKEKQKKERVEIEKKKNGPIPPKYRKHTQEYLLLKQEEKMLVSARRFDEANVIQQRARRLEGLEDQMIRQEWIGMIDKDLKKLTEKHKQQIKVRQMNIKKEKNNIEQTKKNELGALKNKITFLEKQINELEQFGVENTEKPTYIYMKQQETKNEEEEISEAPCNFDNKNDTEDEKSKVSVACSESTNEIFFTITKKIEINNEEQNISNDDQESNEINIDHNEINENDFDKNSNNVNYIENKENEIDNKENNDNESKESDNNIIINNNNESNINDDDYNNNNNNINNDESNENNIDYNLNNDDNINNNEISQNKENNIDDNNINGKIDQTEEAPIKLPKFDIHPPQENEGQRNGYRKRYQTSNQNSYEQNENENIRQDQNSNVKVPKIVSAAYLVNNDSSLPRLPISRTPRKPKKKLSGPEAFRQRALLNRQLYCGKTLLSQHEINRRDQLKQKRRKEIAKEDSK